MKEPFDPGEPGEDQLDEDRRRIAGELGKPHAARIEAMLRGELRWLEARRRALRRTPVSCYAILHTPGGAATVRVRDLSAIGAGLESPAPPRVGERVQLEFPALLGRPTVECVVRHASARERRVGVEFARGCETATKVSEELVRCFATAAT